MGEGKTEKGQPCRTGGSPGSLCVLQGGFFCLSPSTSPPLHRPPLSSFLFLFFLPFIKFNMSQDRLSLSCWQRTLVCFPPSSEKGSASRPPSHTCPWLTEATFLLVVNGFLVRTPDPTAFQKDPQAISECVSLTSL